MQMHHATRGAPFKYGYIRAGTIQRDHHRLQDEFESHSTIPCYEERVLVHKLPALTFAEVFVVLNSLNHSYDAYNVIPVITLSRQRAEQGRDVPWNFFSIFSASCHSCFDFNLLDHGQDDSAQLRLAGLRSRNVCCIANHVLGQRPDTHATNVIQRVAVCFRVIAHVPLLCTEDLCALDHVEPPVTERHVRLRMPAT